MTQSAVLLRAVWTTWLRLQAEEGHHTFFQLIKSWDLSTFWLAAYGCLFTDDPSSTCKKEKQIVIAVPQRQIHSHLLLQLYGRVKGKGAVLTTVTPDMTQLSHTNTIISNQRNILLPWKSFHHIFSMALSRTSSMCHWSELGQLPTRNLSLA